MVAGELGRALEATLGVRSSVVVLSRAELAKVITDNPFPDEANPKHLHAIFRGASSAPRRPPWRPPSAGSGTTAAATVTKLLAKLDA